MQQDVGYTGVYVGFLFVWLWYQFYRTNAKKTPRRNIFRGVFSFDTQVTQLKQQFSTNMQVREAHNACTY